MHSPYPNTKHELDSVSYDVCKQVCPITFSTSKRLDMPHSNMSYMVHVYFMLCSLCVIYVPCAWCRTFHDDVPNSCFDSSLFELVNVHCPKMENVMFTRVEDTIGPNSSRPLQYLAFVVRSFPWGANFFFNTTSWVEEREVPNHMEEPVQPTSNTTKACFVSFYHFTRFLGQDVFLNSSSLCNYNPLMQQVWYNRTLMDAHQLEFQTDVTPVVMFLLILLVVGLSVLVYTLCRTVLAKGLCVPTVDQVVVANCRSGSCVPTVYQLVAAKQGLRDHKLTNPRKH